MRQYETAFLISPNLSEEDTEKIITQMGDVISQKKGKMLKEDRWGKRKLAYPIKNFEEAFYVFFLYEGSPDILAEFERHFKQTEAILRYLTVKKDAPVKESRKKKAASREEERPDSLDKEKGAKEEDDKKDLSSSEKNEKEK